VKRVILGTIGLALFLVSQGRPDFSGTWSLDPARSNFGPLGPPSSFERVIRQTPNRLSSVTRQSSQAGESKTEVQFSLDGKENILTINGDEARVTAKWVMSNLVIETKRKNAGGDVHLLETWSLEEAGKSLMIQAKMTRNGNVVPLTLFLVRQK
jgi:hypothetical protein